MARISQTSVELATEERSTIPADSGGTLRIWVVALGAGDTLIVRAMFADGDEEIELSHPGDSVTIPLHGCQAIDLVPPEAGCTIARLDTEHKLEIGLSPLAYVSDASPLIVKTAV